MAISGKVAASTVGSAASTLVAGIVAHHTVGASIPSDVLGLVEAGLVAAVTFAAGYFANHTPAQVAADAEKVAEALPGTAIAQVASGVAQAVAPKPPTA